MNTGMQQVQTSHKHFYSYNHQTSASMRATCSPIMVKKNICHIQYAYPLCLLINSYVAFPLETDREKKKKRKKKSQNNHSWIIEDENKV